MEIRSAWGINILDLDADQLATVQQILTEYGLQVSSIGSPIGKIFIDEDFEPHLERMRHAAEVAAQFGAPYIRLFSFFIREGDNPDDHRDEVLRRMRALADVAEQAGVVLVHENEKEIYGDIPRRCLDIVTSVDSPNLKLAWDPANFVQVGVRPFTEGYAELRPHVAYIQIKDALLADAEVVVAGAGDGEVRETIRALRADGFDGFFSLEPHLGDQPLGGFSGPELCTRPGRRSPTSSPAKGSSTHEQHQLPGRTRFAIVGAGVIGRHARAGAAELADRVELVAVVDTQLERAEKLVASTAARRSPRWPMRSRGRGRRRHGLHPDREARQVAIEALEAGKHVIIEKPAETTVGEDRRDHRRPARGRHPGGRHLPAPLRPATEVAVAAIAKGELGRLTSGMASIDWWRGQTYYDSGDWRGTWELDGGGALMNQGVHTVDLLVATMGRPVEVFAYTGTLAHERIEVEDVAVGVVRFESGALGVLHATTAAYPGLSARLQVHGDRGLGDHRQRPARRSSTPPGGRATPELPSSAEDIDQPGRGLPGAVRPRRRPAPTPAGCQRTPTAASTRTSSTRWLVRERSGWSWRPTGRRSASSTACTSPPAPAGRSSSHDRATVQHSRIAANPIPYWSRGGTDKSQEVFETAFAGLRRRSVSPPSRPTYPKA